MLSTWCKKSMSLWLTITWMLAAEGLTLKGKTAPTTAAHVCFILDLMTQLRVTGPSALST